LGVHLHVDSEHIGSKRLATQRPFALSDPVYSKLSISSSEDKLDVIELASSCVVNATRHD
jgi:hypothetical protein